MRIDIISGLSSRVADLTRLWGDYRDFWNHRNAGSESAADVPASTPEPRKQALLHPRRGSLWFSANALRNASRRLPDTNNNRVGKDEQSGNPGLGASRREDPEAVEPIPRNIPGESPIRPDKPKARLLSEPVYDRQSFPAKQETGAPTANDRARDLSSYAKQAVNQRAAFFHLLEKKLKEIPFLR